MLIVASTASFIAWIVTQLSEPFLAERLTLPNTHTRETTMRFASFILIVLLSETSLTFAQGHMGTPKEQQACSRDAQRFCRQQLGNDGAVQQCLQQNKTKLSKGCQKVFASHGM